MNDAKFIELLNLFLDHEISSADAKLLEAEVQRSAARRRVYREYCEMQKACLALAEESAASAVVVEFKPAASYPRTRAWHLGAWGLGTYAVGFCAAAACLALALVFRAENSSVAAAARTVAPSTFASIQVEVPATREQGRRDVPLTVSLNPRSTELQPVFVAQSLALTKQQRETVALTVFIDSRFDWMSRVQLTSLQKINADELVFEARPSLQSDPAILRSRWPIDRPFEQAAFQFQR